MLSKLFNFAFATIAFTVIVLAATVHGEKADPHGSRQIGICYEDAACKKGATDLRTSSTARPLRLEPADGQACVGFEAAKSGEGSICAASGCSQCKTNIPKLTCFGNPSGKDWYGWCG